MWIWFLDGSGKEELQGIERAVEVAGGSKGAECEATNSQRIEMHAGASSCPESNSVAKDSDVG